MYQVAKFSLAVHLLFQSTGYEFVAMRIRAKRVKSKPLARSVLNSTFDVKSAEVGATASKSNAGLHDGNTGVIEGFEMNEFGIQTATVNLKAAGIVRGDAPCYPKDLIATRHAQARHNVAEEEVAHFLGERLSENASVDDRLQVLHELLEQYPESLPLPAKVQRKLESEEASPDDIKDVLQKALVLPNPRFSDAELSERGLMQTVQKVQELQTFLKASGKDPQLVFISPLRRTMLTGLTLWPGKALIGLDLIVEKRTGFPCDTRRPLEMILSEPPYVENGRILLLTGSAQDLRTMAGLNLAPPNAQAHPLKERWTSLIDDEVARPSVKKGVHREETWKENDEAMKVYRAWVFLQWVAGLQFDPDGRELEDVAIVSHKGFLREMELAAGFHKGDRNVAKKGGLYGNAETRIYHLRCD